MAGVVRLASNNTPWKHVRQVRQQVVHDLRHVEDFERKGEAKNVACRQCTLANAGMRVLSYFSLPDVRRLEMEVSEKSASEYGRTLSITFERCPQGLYLLERKCEGRRVILEVRTPG